MRPRPGVWPVAPERLPLREAWVSKYEAVACSYAACRFLADLGSGIVDPRARAVADWHDQLSRAREPLPIA